MKKHAFTLVELLVVIAIMAIIAAISVPAFRSNQAIEVANETAFGIEDMFERVRSGKLLNRKCVPVEQIDGVLGQPAGDSGLLALVTIRENPNYKDLPVLTVSSDSLFLSCGIASWFNVFNKVEEYVFDDFNERVDVEVYLLSENIGEGLVKMGEVNQDLGVSVDSIYVLPQPGKIGVDIENNDLSAQVAKFLISVPGTDYKKSVCFYANTLLTTSTDGAYCEDPIDPSR